MESRNILQESSLKKQSKITRRDQPDCAGVSPNGNAEISFIPNGKGVRPDDVDDAVRAGSIHKDRPRQTTESSRAGYLEVHAESIRALLVTLKEVRGLRDGMLREDEYSQASLLLAQLTLILERIERGIPSGHEAFVAILRAARLPEPTPEAAEPTTEMAETT